MRILIFLTLVIITSCQNVEKKNNRSNVGFPDIASHNILIDKLKELYSMPIFWGTDSMVKTNCCYAIGFYMKRFDNYNLGGDTLVSFSFYRHDLNYKLDQDEIYYKGCCLIDGNYVLIFDKYNIGEAYYSKLHLLKDPLKDFKSNKQRGFIFCCLLQKGELKLITLKELIKRSHQYDTLTAGKLIPFHSCDSLVLRGEIIP